MLLTASCVRIERVQESVPAEIKILPLGVTSHNAPSMTKAPYPQYTYFGVFAFYTDGQEATPWTTVWPATDYFTDAAFFYYGSTASGWDVSTATGVHKPYYWPIDGSLMFAGYSPHKSQTESVKSVSFNKNALEKAPNPYLEIEFEQNTDPNNMVDLLWFDIKDVNDGKTISTTAQSVPVQFKHALSMVTLKFTDINDYYDLESVVLEDCINKSTFYSGNTCGWMPQITELADYTLKSSKTKLNQWNSCDLLIIPQYLDGIFPVVGGSLDSGVDVVLSFVVADSYGSQELRLPLKTYTEKWEIGKHYTYTISVDADPIGFGAPNVTINTQVVSM